jgi:hypothetical protein
VEVQLVPIATKYRRLRGERDGEVLIGSGRNAARCGNDRRGGERTDQDRYAISKTGPFAPAAHTQINTYELWQDQVNAAAASISAARNGR